MSARLNLTIGIGTLAVMLIMSFGNLYFTNQGKQQSEQNNADIDRLEKKLDGFIERWDKRVDTSNKVNNGTQAKIVDGVNEIIGIVKQEFGNLTQHRLVTNATFEKIEKILNQTSGLTGPEYDKLADKKVKDIVGNVTELIKNDRSERPKVK